MTQQPVSPLRTLPSLQQRRVAMTMTMTMAMAMAMTKYGTIIIPDSGMPSERVRQSSSPDLSLPPHRKGYQSAVCAHRFFPNPNPKQHQTPAWPAAKSGSSSREGFSTELFVDKFLVIPCTISMLAWHRIPSTEL